MSIKKIAIISNSCPPLGGSGIGSAHYNLYKMLMSRGYNTKIYTYADSYTEIKKIGIEKDIYRNGNSVLAKKFINILLIVQYKFERWILRTKKITGLAYQFPIVLGTILAAKKINKYLKVFEPDVVIIPDMGAPGYSIKKNKKTIYVHVSHHNPVRFLNNPLITNHDKVDAYRAVSFEQFSLKNIDGVICPCNYMRNVFVDTFQYKGSIIVVPNIVDNDYIEKIEKIDLRKVLKIENDVPVVFIPSAGSSIKGERYVVEILRRLNKELNQEVAFYLNSDLSENQKFELEYLNIKYFAPGQVDNRLNISYLKNCSLCISPTLIENFSMALLEVMFCSIPCVSFNVGGNSDLIDSGETGFLVPYLDLEQLIEKSLLLLKNSKLYEDVKAKINIKISNEFSSQKVIERYISFFNLLALSKAH